MHVQAMLPLPWQWGHKSRLLPLHRGSMIYACPAGIVNFFLMFKIRHSKGGRHVSGSFWRSRLLPDLPAMLFLAPQALGLRCRTQQPSQAPQNSLQTSRKDSKSPRLMLIPGTRTHYLIPETSASSCLLGAKSMHAACLYMVNIVAS